MPRGCPPYGLAARTASERGFWVAHTHAVYLDLSCLYELMYACSLIQVDVCSTYVLYVQYVCMCVVQTYSFLGC